MSERPNKPWTPEQVATLTLGWSKGITPSQIGKEIGKSRNAVIGKSRRLGLAKTSTKTVTVRSGREGQAEFRRRTLVAYEHRCCMTGSTQTEVLEAAHIVPYSDTKNNSVENALCLRRDLHALLDAGLIKITPSFFVEVSSKVSDDDYRKFHGQMIFRPKGSDYFRMSEFLSDRNKTQGN